MGKKRKGKKTKKYNKKQFKNVFCTRCPICDGVPKNPDFCYPLYNDEPFLFISKILPRLDEIKSWSTKVRFESEEEVELFKEVFCMSGICEDSWTGVDGEDSECPLIPDCIEEFHIQLKRTKGHSKKKKKRKKVKYICEPYPTFFSSSKEGFREKIEEILRKHATSKNNNIE